MWAGDGDEPTGGQASGPAAAAVGAGAPTPAASRMLRDEVWIVLLLTFLASAVRSVLDLVERPRLEGTTAVLMTTPDTTLDLVRQLVGLGLALVPVLLVIHLLRRSGESARDIGLTLRPRRRLRRDLGRGVALAAVIGAVGIGWYALAVAAGFNRNVVVIDGAGPWWTVPVWIASSLRFALTEEIIVAGYLLHRLDQLGWSANRSLGASALLRGGYHLYQGFGGFLGNLAMGLLFGRVYQRTRRTVPLVTAHFLVDAVAGLGYLALRNRVGWLTND